jgi:uncharacterized protein (UPF0147 family)
MTSFISMSEVAPEDWTFMDAPVFSAPDLAHYEGLMNRLDSLRKQYGVWVNIWRELREIAREIREERENRMITRAREAVLVLDEIFNSERMDEVHFTLGAMEFEMETAQREIEMVVAVANRKAVGRGVLGEAE